MEKTYLGDGVYAEFDGYYVWIYISNGVTESTRIAIEPQVKESLDFFFRKCWTTPEES